MSSASRPPAVPAFSEPPEVHADYLEFSAIAAAGELVSWERYARDLAIGGSIDASEDADYRAPEEFGPKDYIFRDDEKLEALLDAVSHELEERARACGSGKTVPAYPFEVSRSGVTAYDTGVEDRYLVYDFLLLLSLLGKDAGAAGANAERLFEDLSRLALHEYLGGPSRSADAVVFGFPRRLLPPGFPDAVDDLCARLSEGGSHRDVPESVDQKDAHLDLVGWRAFPDGRTSKLIFFGQCATGSNWRSKLTELQPDGWCKAWLREPLAVNPVRAYFLPHRVDRDLWRTAAIYGGVLFDRCRVVWLIDGMDQALRDELRAWVNSVLSP